MGESEMKMDEQQQSRVSELPTIRIEDTKKASEDDITHAAPAVEEALVNGDADSVEDADQVKPADQQQDDEEEKVTDAVEELLAGDSKPNDEHVDMHVECVDAENEMELKSVVEFETNEADAESEQVEKSEEVLKVEEAEDEEEKDDGEQPPGADENSSILEGALKNGNADNHESLNKMHMDVDAVREGCSDSAGQPSSPGHAELRSQSAEPETTETASLYDDSQAAIKVEDCSADDDDLDADDKSPKRKSHDDDDDDDEPARKLKKECHLRNKILTDYTDALDMSNYEQIQHEEHKLIVEVQHLGDIAKEKERQWNNIIHMKIMKEELLMRIQRQKQVCLMSNGDADGDGGKQMKNSCAGAPSAADMNGHDAKGGRNKGMTMRNVQSIIADYRQRHPETVPRRGRRIRNVNGGGSGSESGRTVSYANVALGSGSQVRSVDAGSDIALLLTTMENAHPGECADAYKEFPRAFLDQIAQCERRKTPTAAPPPPFPEVTVHAVTSSSASNSLLHGILTKTQAKSDSRTTFSPTLARLLTAPDKSHAVVAAAAAAAAQPHKSSANVSISDILSTNKARSEITITPVTSDYEDTHHTHSKRKQHMEDETTEDSVDRLVIDESNELADSRADNTSDGGDEVPQCQGCNQKAAQFVCAGCGNQWYCSRECQVTAWDEHSDVCSG